MGVMAAVVGRVTVLFSMGGAELATIAAAESKKPVEYAGKATKQVMRRVFLFYVASVFRIVPILPWNTSFAGEHISSPFAVVLARPGRRSWREPSRGRVVPRCPPPPGRAS